MANAQADSERSTLHIGDYVLLKDTSRGCYLSVEGILLEDVSVVEGTDNLIDCIFCVHLQRQYSASRDLQAFLKTYNNDVKSIEDESAKKYLLALQKGRENEKKLNDSYMKNKYGQRVNFGDIIQLYHLKSRKYITVTDQLAKDERENTRILLDVNGSAFSWIQISPRFKIDKEGDPLLNHAEMYLKIAERSNEYMHTADRNPLEGLNREVNCALESTPWRLSIYQSSLDTADPNTLMCAQIVTLFDPETRSNFTFAEPKLESLEDPSESGEESTSGEYSVILEPNLLDEFNSNCLWILEGANRTIGGPIAWKAETVRFRHFNSGRYLAARFVVDEETNMESVQLVAGTDADGEESAFNVAELNSTNMYLSDGRAIQLSHMGNWLERGDIEEAVYPIKTTKDKSIALSLIINRYDGSSSKFKSTGPDNSEEASAQKQLEPLDVNAGLSIRKFLHKYRTMIKIPKRDTLGTVWPKEVRNDLEFFQFVADKAVYFSQGFPISVQHVQLGIDKGDNKIMKFRQSLLREQGSLEEVLRAISLLIPMTERLEKIRAKAGKRKQARVSDEEHAAVNMAQSILSKCFSIIFYAIINNEVNQMYVADFMPVLLAHLNAQPLAGKCVTEMLSKNMELQETKIGEREIQIFVDKLRSSRMNAMYLQLLQACCSCEGDGVDGNQCKVAKKLFSDTNDIIIQIHPDYARATVIQWETPSLYIPNAPVAGSPVRGDHLITKGLPKLSLAWTTNSIDFSPLGLFGKLSVNVDELFKPSIFDEVERLDRKKGNKKKSSQDQKKAVANYFIAEMFLVAEMCMDRNYVAMHLLDDLFPYEVLVTVLKLDVSNQLKAAAVRLLMCLHVDRDPQAMSKIPCLTRTWSDIKKDLEPQLPFVENARMYMFGLIQQIISEHVRSMAGSPWDALSQHMLKMLKTMAQFNFYGTNERLLDVIVPLIHALDRRNVGNWGDRSVAAVTIPVKRAGGKTIAAAAAAGAGEGNADERELDQPANMLVTLKSNRAPKTSSLDDTVVPVAPEDDKQLTDRIDYTRDDIEAPASTPWYVRLVEMAQGCVSSVANLNFQAARVMMMDDEADSVNKTDGYVPPLRYSKAPIYELETMVEAVDILAFAQKVIEDRNISLLLRYFYRWEAGLDKRSPAELFEQVIVDSKALSLDIESFDDVMIDTLMFVHTPLVQSTLEVLMAHHSTRRILLDNAKNIQLLASHRRERQYKLVDSMLKQLEQNAETHELWGELETDADYAVNKQTKDIMRELTDMCRVRRYTFEFDEDFTADVEMQNLLRNLGCFEICMKVIGLLESVEEDENGELDEVGTNTKELCLLCNELFYWFFLRNAKNQVLGFEELSLFLDSLDKGIGSHKVIFSLFSMNEALMRQVPHALLSDLVDRMLREGLSHYFLSLFAAIPNVGNKNIKENQMEIVRVLTSPGVVKKLGCYLVPIQHPDYQVKKEMMAPYLENDDVDLDELPPPLAFHFMFLNVLSGCTVGQKNVSTVEAKVQSVFNYPDIIDSILDPGTMLMGRIVLVRFLYNAIFDVELKIPGIENSPRLWKLIDSFKEVLEHGKQEIMELEAHGWDSPSVSRRRLEYLVLAIMVIRQIFSANFDISNYRPPENKKGVDQTFVSAKQIHELIVVLFRSLKNIHDLKVTRFSFETKTLIYETLEVLKSQSEKYIHGSDEGLGGGAAAVARKKPVAEDNVYGIEVSLPIDTSAETDQKTGRKRDAAEEKLIGRYQEFLTSLESDKNIQYKADNENVAFIRILESLPYIADPVEADVRYESLIRKLVFHIRENVKMVNNQKRMDARVTATSTWIIRAFRTMIENRMGMSIYERDEEGGEEQDINAAPVVNALNTCGGTALCLDLIADGIDEKLQMEAIKLGVGLLFKEGGALEVQGIMNAHLSQTNSELFFRQVRLTLQKLQEWHEWNEFAKAEGQPAGEEPPKEILIVRFLQLMCEGHYLPNQDIMREQPNNRVSYNILDDLVNYLNYLSRIPCDTSTDAAIRLSATILEVIQGPCVGNQTHFALSTELVETLNRLNRARVGDDKESKIQLKRTSIDILQALLEGQGDESVVYDRVLSVVHLDIINIMSKKFLTNSTAPPTLEEVELQTECVILLQMFCTYRPSLFDELGISRKVEDIVGSGTAMIEVVWRGDIHRRFFHVPPVCEFLAKSSKDNLVENVDRSSPENKLIDFLERSHVLYREVKHQEYLTNMGLSRIFNRVVQNRATWINFILSLVNNGIFLMKYYGDDDGTPQIPALYDSISTYINAAQVAVASFTFILWIVVSSPVTYQGHLEEGVSPTEAILYTAMEPLTMYYVFYLSLCFLGLFVANYFCSLQLLDIIVKDSTTRAVLEAIVTPAKQLLMAAILEIFVIYIFAFYIFFFYPEDTGGFCDTMWNCFKFTVSYGLQNGGGVADAFEHSTGLRLILDVLFFVVVIIILLNVFLGMIIDTFGSLRADKNETLRDTTEICFICGIIKQVFDRASDEPDGFHTHVKIDHNMWNYLYFIFLLWEQDKDDDDGLEQYVRRAIEANEITWFPINKAMRLERVATKAEILRKDLHDAVHETESTMLTKLDEFQTDVSSMLHGLMKTLKQEPHGDHVANAADGGGGSHHDGAGGDDEGSLADDLSLASGSTYMQELLQGKQVSVAFDGIDGLELPLEDLLLVSLRIITDSGAMFSVPNYGADAQARRVNFDVGTFVPIFDNVMAKDRRSMQIQVLLGDARVMTTVATLDFKASELVAHKETLVMSRPFARSGQSQICTFTMHVRVSTLLKPLQQPPLSGTNANGGNGGGAGFSGSNTGRRTPMSGGAGAPAGRHTPLTAVAVTGSNRPRANSASSSPGLPLANRPPSSTPHSASQK